MTTCKSTLKRMEAQHEGKSDTPWKDAILNQLAITHMDAPLDESPAVILQRIIDWHLSVVRESAEAYMQLCEEAKPIVQSNIILKARNARLRVAANTALDALCECNFHDIGSYGSFLVNKANGELNEALNEGEAA